MRAEGSAHERAPGIDCQRRGCGDKSLAGMMNESGQRRDGFRGFLVSLCAAAFLFDSAHHKNKQNNFMPVVHFVAGSPLPFHIERLIARRGQQCPPKKGELREAGPRPQLLCAAGRHGGARTFRILIY
jgi:hypothetical protein